jgi:transposase-like protein
MSTPTILHPNPVCPQCGCKGAAKKGKRLNRMQTLQVYRCSECLHRFTGEPGKNKTYPLRVILEAVSTFDLGHSLTETQQIMRGRFHRQIPERTISSWLAEYRPHTTYSRLRAAGRKLYNPQLIIRSHTFHHQQVYRFQVHRAKLELLMQTTAHQATHAHSEFKPLTDYLASVESQFPHALFQATGHRSSKFPAEIRPPV